MSASSLERLKSLLLQNSQELNLKFIHSLDLIRDSEKIPAWKMVFKEIETGHLNPLGMSDGQRKQIEFLERCYLDFLSDYQVDEATNSLYKFEENLNKELDRAEMLVSQGFVRRGLRLVKGVDNKAIDLGLFSLALKVRQIEARAHNFAGQTDRFNACFSDLLLLEKQQLVFKCVVHKFNQLISLLGCGAKCEMFNIYKELKEELSQLRRQTGWGLLNLLEALLRLFSLYLNKNPWSEDMERIYVELQRERAVLVKWGIFTKSSGLDLLFAKLASYFRNTNDLFCLLKELSNKYNFSASEQFEYYTLKLDYYVQSNNFSELSLFLLKFNEWIGLNKALFKYEEEKIRAYRFIVYSLNNEFERALKNLELCIQITKSVKSRHLMYRFLKVAFLLENGHLVMTNTYITATLKYLSRNRIAGYNQDYTDHLRELGNSIENPEVVYQFHRVCKELCEQNGAMLLMDFKNGYRNLHACQL